MMRLADPTQLQNSEKFTRRRMIGMLASAGAGVAVSPLLSRRAFAEIKMQAEIIFEPHIPTALRRALQYAGDDGFVASMPQLLHARANAPYDNIIWNTWFTSNSEESVDDPAGKPCRGGSSWWRHICITRAI